MSRSGAAYAPYPRGNPGRLYVSPNGDDNADGRTPGSARKSLAATVASLPAGGQVTMLAGAHSLDATLPATNYVTIDAVPGASLDTTMPLVAPTTNMYGLIIRNLKVRAHAHVVSLGGSGGLIQSAFVDTNFVTDAAVSVVNVTAGAGFQQNQFLRGEIWRAPTATVPAINIVDSIGAATGNSFERITIYGQSCTAAPAIHIEAASQGSYAYLNLFIGVVGEQNLGGLMTLLSHYQPYVINCGDFDGGTYVADVIHIDASPTNTTRTLQPVVINSGKVGGVLGSGVANIGMPVTGVNSPVVIGSGTADPALSISPYNTDGIQLQEGVTGYGAALLALRKFGDTQDHATIGGDGTIWWGSGAAAPDTRLYRPSAAKLATTGAFAVGGALLVAGSAAATTPGSVVAKLQIFDYTSGSSLGYLPIYNGIT